MLEGYNAWRVLEVFFSDPSRDYQLSEISQKVGIARKSVSIHLRILERRGLIVSARHRTSGRRLYRADAEGVRFRFYKRIHTLTAIAESGLIPFLEMQCSPNCIILFGSAARGEDGKESDLDLFIQSARKALALQPFERKLQRTISPLFAADPAKLSAELRNNLANGIVLSGYLKVL